MYLQRSSESLEAAVAVASLLADLRFFIPENLLQSHIRDFGVDVLFGMYGNPDPYVPDWYVAADNNATMILITGAKNPTLQFLVADGYLSPYGMHRRGTFHPWAYECAVRIVRQIYDRNYNVHPRVVIGGYSAGGMIALAVAYLLKARANRPNITVFTYGSPKPGGEEVAANLRGVDFIRYMATEDAVPNLPPRPQDAQLIYFLANARGRQIMQEYQQPDRGRVIDAMGNISFAFTPPVQGPFTEISVSAFASNHASDASAAHQIETYVSRIRTARLNSPPEDDGVPAGDGARRNHIAEFQMGSANDPRIRGPFPEPPEVVRNPPVFARENSPYFAAKENGLSVVKFNGDTIAVCAGSKAARNLASSLNTSFRRWNRTKWGSAALLVDSVDLSFVD